MRISSIWSFRRKPVSQLFYDFGIHCATHQIRVILICGLVITSFFYPALAIYFSHQPLSHFSTRILDSLFLPSANDAFHHNDLHDLWQGYDALRIRTDAATRARCGTEHTVRVERLFIPSTTPDPFGALNPQTLIPALDFQAKLEGHLTPELPCVRILDNTIPATPPTHKCLVVSPTAHWDDNAASIAAESHLYTSLNNAHRNVSRGGIPLTAEMALAGRLTTDHAGYGSIIESSKFLSISFFFREDDCHSNAGHDAWTKLVKELAPPEAATVASGDQPKLLALEFAALSQSYSSWVSVGLYLVYIIIFVQLSGSMRRMDSVHSRFGLTFTGMIEILASTITSVSICAIAGFRVTMVPWSILPIVIVIVGAENMFVLMEAVLATSISLPVRRRIAEGLQKAGVSITLKLIMYNAVLGTIAYFASGAIRQFCVFVIVVLVAHWFLIHTFFLAVLSIDLQRLELSDVLRQGGTSPRESPSSYAPDQRTSRTRFGLRRVFKTKAARNVSLMLVLAITGGLYYYSGPFTSARTTGNTTASFDGPTHSLHHLTPTQSVSTPYTAPSHPHLQEAPTTPAMPSTSLLIWRTLNPPNDPLVHIRVEPPILVLFPPPAGSNAGKEEILKWSHRVRQLRPVLWTLKILVLPIGATLAALYGLLLHLLRNAELRAAQHDRVDSLVEGEAEEHEREKEKEKEKSEGEMGASFTTLPRASKSDVSMVRCSQDGAVVAAVSVEGVVLVWSTAGQERGAASPGGRSVDSGRGSSESDSLGEVTSQSPPMFIPVPVAGARASSLAIDSEGRTLAVAGGGVVQIWDIGMGYPLLGRRLSSSVAHPSSKPEEAVRDVKFLPSAQEASPLVLPPFASAKSRSTAGSPAKRAVLVAYGDGSVAEWDLDSGEMLAQLAPRHSIKAQSALFARGASVSVAFLYSDGRVDVYGRRLDTDGVPSYAPTVSLNVPGVAAIDVFEWSLGPLFATLTASGHVAVWDLGSNTIVEMDLGLSPEQHLLFPGSTAGARISLLPTPPASLPCRQCGNPAASSFTLAFSLPSSTHSPSSSAQPSTVYIRRASVLYQPGRCSCQPISIASTLAGPRVISFGVSSGVRIVSGVGVGGANGGAAASEFPVSAHGLRRSSSSYGRHSFDSNSSAAAEDSEYGGKESSGLLAPPTSTNGVGHKPIQGSDVRWEQHAMEESCERGQWDVVGTHIVGIRRKSRVSKLTGEDTPTRNAATKPEELPSAVLERWEVWQVDTTTASLPRRLSSLSRICDRNEPTCPAPQVNNQSNSTMEPHHSPHMARILRLGRAANSRSPPLSPRLTGGRPSADSRHTLFPRLPFTRVSSMSASYDGLYAGLGNTIGVVRLEQLASSQRQ